MLCDTGCRAGVSPHASLFRGRGAAVVDGGNPLWELGRPHVKSPSRASRESLAADGETDPRGRPDDTVESRRSRGCEHPVGARRVTASM
jgi:hypothetical protein